MRSWVSLLAASPVLQTRPRRRSWVRCLLERTFLSSLSAVNQEFFFTQNISDFCGSFLSQTIGRDLGNVLATPARRGVISRRAGLPLHSPPVDLQTREQLASRGLAHVRDEDLRLLSVLTRRALESLD